MARPERERQDPTNQARNRRRGTRVLQARLSAAERQIKRLFRDIPRTRSLQTPITNAEKTAVYDYAISDQGLIELSNTIQFILNDELLETQSGTPVPNWYWEDNIEPPYRGGVLQEANRMEQLISAAVVAGVIADIATPSPDQILFSSQYAESLRKVYVENFESIKTLSERTASQVSQRVSAGIGSGKKPSAIVADISERFEVANSSAARTSDTSVNKAYNDGRTNSVSVVQSQTGLRSGVIHISALLPTTRQGHAARHGNAYTVADQLQWWDTGANRINCKCSVRSVLIDSSGRVVEAGFQEQIKDEKSFFDQ